MQADEKLSFLGYSTNVTYEDIKSIERSVLNKFIRETTDCFRVQMIFYAVLGHNDQITMMCVDKYPYLAGDFTEEYIEKNLKTFKEVAKKYPKEALSAIIDLDDPLMEKLAPELFEGLMLKPIFIHRLSDNFLLNHPEETMKVIAKKQIGRAHV